MLSDLKIAPKVSANEAQLILRPAKGKQKPYVTKGGLLPVKNEQKTAGFEENRAWLRQNMALIQFGSCLVLQTNHQTENFRISTKLDLTCTKHSPWSNLGPVSEKFWQ